MIGQGSDAGDKAIYKALTGATKYALLKLFLIATGDDPEHEPIESPKRQSTSSPAPRQEQPKAAKQLEFVKDSPEARARFEQLLTEAKTAANVAAAGGFGTKHLSKAIRDELRPRWNEALKRATGPDRDRTTEKR